MQSININAIAAVHEVAATIAGVANVDAPVLLVDRDLNAGREVFAGRDYTEILVGDRARTTVTIHRPTERWSGGGDVERATVTWSSSDSYGGVEDAAATARFLAFAAQVAEQLNRWLDAGQLPYLDGAESRDVPTHDVSR